MTTSQNKHTFEAQILRDVREAAWARALVQDQNPLSIARSVLVKAAREAEPSPDQVAHPARRPTDAIKVRIRVVVDRATFEIVKERVRTSGISLTGALEAGLTAYARTGKV